MIDKEYAVLSEQVAFSARDKIQYPTVYGEGILYLKKMEKEKGISALFYTSCHLSGAHDIRLTEPGLHVSSSINEYGGKPFWLNQHDLYLVNAQDQRIYQLDLQSAISLSSSYNDKTTPLKPISPSCYQFNQSCSYCVADVVFINKNNPTISEEDYILAVVECIHTHTENQHVIAACKRNGSSQQWQIVESGADFYSNLVYDDTTKTVAWVQWNHPNMPWDNTQLYIANVSCHQKGVWLDKKEEILRNRKTSICQLLFSSNQQLFFVADFADSQNKSENFWNIYCYQLAEKSVQQISFELREFGYPHWQYGDARLSQHNQDDIIAIASQPSGDAFFVINIFDLSCRKMLSHHKGDSIEYFENLNSNQQGVSVAMRFVDNNNAHIVQLSGVDYQRQLLKISEPKQTQLCLSQATFIHYPVGDELSDNKDVQDATQPTAHGLFYPCAHSQDTLPPLIVMAHGGPTAHTDARLDLQKQYWTSRGFAIFDVNYRGSSGYGRNYRDALLTHWGNHDINDIVRGVKQLIDKGWVDPKRICIRGKSAGGYTALKALTDYPDMFCAGACYYGIGDLQALAEVTHKFEKHYTDNLIGEVYNKEGVSSLKSLYFQRSPIHFMDKIKSAMIVFQGGKDKVVPPVMAQQMIEHFKKMNVRHEYTFYPDEGHGFKQVSNIVDAHTKELQFYLKVFTQ